MNRMVGDLLDFTRSRLGSGLPIARRAMDLAILARNAVDEISGAQPKGVIQLETSGDLRGEWDSERISQVLANLLANAVEYGPEAPITLTVKGEAKEVVLRVHNGGAPIPASALPGLFSALKRQDSGKAGAHDSSNLGLGLYITERIVTAHGGSIEVESSSEAGTTFTVRLRR